MRVNYKPNLSSKKLRVPPGKRAVKDSLRDAWNPNSKAELQVANAHFAAYIHSVLQLICSKRPKRIEICML